MANTDIHLSAGQLIRGHGNLVVTVEVDGLRWALFRLRCAMPLVWLAAKVAGTGFIVQHVESDS